MHIAILGIGEVGGAISRDLLEQGVTVSGWDPNPKDIPDGLQFAKDNPEAARHADLILSANLASVALEVATEVVPVLGGHQIFADLNTAAPEVKRQMASLFQDSQAQFVDVAIMSPILPHGLGVPTIACGNGAEAFSRGLSQYGMPITVLDGPPGEAAAHKLLRSIFYKGLAAVVLETVEAAEAMGLEQNARDQMMTILKEEVIVDRFVQGSKQHAARRVDEMDAVISLLEELGIDAYTSSAARKRLLKLSQPTSTQA